MSPRKELKLPTAVSGARRASGRQAPLRRLFRRRRLRSGDRIGRAQTAGQTRELCERRPLSAQSGPVDLRRLRRRAPLVRSRRRQSRSARSQAHKFWSWKMRVSPDEQLVGTVTGQYLAGGYKYEPAAETEPSVKVYETATRETALGLSARAADALGRLQPGQPLSRRREPDGRGARVGSGDRQTGRRPGPRRISPAGASSRATTMSAASSI